MLLCTNRDSHEDGSAFAFFSCDADFTADEQRALFHSQQAERARVSCLILGYSDAIVPDFQLETLFVASQLDVKIRSTCVAQNVCQYFLQNAKHCGRPFTTQFDIACIVG